MLSSDLIYNYDAPNNKMGFGKISINRINRGMEMGNNNEVGYLKYLQDKNNKITHALRGNRITCKGLNILQINKGNSNFENKINSLQRIISKEKPDVICISSQTLENLD